MNVTLPPSVALAFAAAILLPRLGAQSISVDSFDGPLTQNEIATFKSYLSTLQPVVWQNTGDIANEYAQGHSGESIKAMGLMYEVTGDTAVLDRMIYFCDVLLEERNDILAAPYGQHRMWTNTIAHSWLGSQTDSTATGNAPDGDCVGHLAYCARLILQTPAILNTAVPEGDIYGHGATYGERAATFIAEGDDSYAGTIFPYFLNLANSNKYYFAANEPYQPGNAVPWNQQAMFTHGLQNLAGAHAILGDNPGLVTQYDGIVQANLNWFFDDSSGTYVQTYVDAAGNTAYNWGYDPSSNAGEDSNHGSLDVAGFYRSYLIGRYGLAAAKMQPLANMYGDVMMAGPLFFAGRVDGTNGTGHGSPTGYVRSGNLFLADLRPDKYYQFVGPDLTAGGTTTSMDTFSRFAWVKNRRSGEGYAITFSPPPGPSTSSQAVTLTPITSGASIRYTTDGSTPSEIAGTLYSGPFTLTATKIVKAMAYKTGMPDSAISTGTYTIWASAPTLAPAGGTYAGSQMVTVASSTGGATIRYTTDGSTPTQSHGTVYSAPVSVSSSSTLRAIAYTSSLSTSNVTSGTYTIGPFVATPTFSPGGGSYSGPQSVTISTTTSGATLYYTIDGSTPNTSSPLYSGPVAVSSGTALNAIGVESGKANSSVGTASYVIGTVSAPTFSLAGGTYTGSQTLALGTTTAGATILFTTDGSAPNIPGGSVYIYVKPFQVASSETVKAYAYAPNTNPSGIDSASYVIVGLPSGWTDTDIGSPSPAGSASFASDTFTVNGGGTDIWGASDQFNYAYRTTTGDFTLTAEVSSETNTDAWAKSGVMARGSTAANDLFVDVFVTPGHGVAMQYRTAVGGTCTNLYGVSGVEAPYWVRLIRAGSLFTALSSPDGNAWTTVGSVSMSMGTEATAGLEVCSHNTSTLCSATFPNVALNVPAQFTLAASASGYHAGYPPSNTVDGIVTVASRWACSGTSWIQYDLGAVHTVTSADIAWSYTHIYPFSIAVSNDGSTWTTVLANQQSNGTALQYQTFALPANASARYVRFNCAGSSYDGYTNISETQLFGF